MLMNFTQKHNVELQLADLTSQQFLNIAIETSKSLGWIYGSVNDNGFVAYTNNGMFAWNAEVRVKIKGGSVDSGKSIPWNKFYRIRQRQREPCPVYICF